MKKLALNLDQLEVESFHVQGDLFGALGTVRGRSDPEPGPGEVDSDICPNSAYCSIVACPPVSISCPPVSIGCETVITCGCSHVYTCAHSCPYPVCIKF